MYYYQFGNKDGETIVFLHGGGLSGKMWSDTIKYLPNYNCIVPDLPGHGLSNHLDLIDLDDCIQRIETLVQETWSSESVHFVGLSMGGMICLNLLGRKPQFVKSMLVSGSTAKLAPILARFNNISFLLYKFLSHKRMAKMLMKNFGIPEKYEGTIIEDCKCMKPETILKISKILTQGNLPIHNEKPLLLLVGQQENNFAKRSAIQITSSVANSARKIVPGAGHVWSFQNPKLFAEVIEGWIKGHTHHKLQDWS